MPLTVNTAPPFGFTGLYEDPAWLREAYQYERDNAQVLASSQQVWDAAHATLMRLYDVLLAYYTKDHSAAAAETMVADAFFASQPLSGTDAMDSAAKVALLKQMVARTAEVGVEDMMRAIRDAACPRIAPGATAPPASLRNILQETYFPSTDGKARKSAPSLNISVLDRYCRSLRKDVNLRWLRKVPLPSAEVMFGRDFYALGSMAMISGVHDLVELGASQTAHIERDATGSNQLGALPGMSPAQAAASAEIRSSPPAVCWTPSGPVKVPVTRSHVTGRDLFYYARQEDPLVVWEPDTITQFPVQLTAGGVCFEPNRNTDWYRTTALGRHLPVLNGVSGTATQMMATFMWLNVPETPAHRFLYALIVWLVNEEQHSFYEVMRGASMAPGWRQSVNVQFDDTILTGLETLSAIPFYVRIHTMLTAGPWRNPKAAVLRSPDRLIDRVYQDKLTGTNGGRPFRDIRPSPSPELAALVAEMQDAEMNYLVAQKKWRDGCKPAKRPSNKNPNRLVRPSPREARILQLWPVLDSYTARRNELKAQIQGRFWADAGHEAGILAAAIAGKVDGGQTIATWLRRFGTEAARLTSLTAEQIMAIRYSTGRGAALVTAVLNSAQPRADTAQFRREVRQIVDTAVMEAFDDYSRSRDNKVGYLLRVAFEPLAARQQAALDNAGTQQRDVKRWTDSLSNPVLVAHHPTFQERREAAEGLLVQANTEIAANRREALEQITPHYLDDLVEEVLTNIDMAYVGLLRIPAFDGDAWRADWYTKGANLASRPGQCFRLTGRDLRVRTMPTALEKATTAQQRRAAKFPAVDDAAKTGAEDVAGLLDTRDDTRRPLVMRMTVQGGGRDITGLKAAPDTHVVILPGSIFRVEASAVEEALPYDEVHVAEHRPTPVHMPVPLANLSGISA